MLHQVDDPAAAETFEREGVLLFDPEIPAKTLDRAVADIELGTRRRGTPWRRGPAAAEGRATDAWITSKHVQRIALAPTVLKLLSTLYGREPHPFQTINFRLGTEQRPHSDAVHFNTEPPGLMCGVWVALEDVDMDSGPLVYYPGSHKLPYVTPDDVGMTIDHGRQKASIVEYANRYEPYIEELIEREGLEARYGTLRKGQAVLWASNLLHGGSPVRVPGRTRRSQVTHYYFEGSRLWKPLVSTADRISWRKAPDIRAHRPG